MNRTEQQNKYYFKCIVLPLGKFLGYHKFEMHEILKDMFIYDTSKELTKEEFTLYCNEIRYWAMSEFSFDIEEPFEPKPFTEETIDEIIGECPKPVKWNFKKK
jgi:hypothetical protein